MKVFVTGGTGFVGRSVVNKLIEHGHATVLLVRSKPTSCIKKCKKVQIKHCRMASVLDKIELQ